MFEWRPTMFIASGTLQVVCLLPWMVLATGTWAVAWVALSFGPVRTFDATLVLRMGPGELHLYREGPARLIDLPGGRPGVLHRPRICIGDGGVFVDDPRRATAVIRPGPNGTVLLHAPGLEVKRRPGVPWRLPEPGELAHGPVPGVNYRVGGLYLRFDGPPGPSPEGSAATPSQAGRASSDPGSTA